MKLTPNSTDTTKGPSDWFTGEVHMDTVATPEGAYGIAATSVHFSPGARTAWHRHPGGQTIYVTEGEGRCARRGISPETIRPGDRVFFDPGEDHWHGASPARFMTHLSLVQVDEHGNSAEWGEHVTDAEYDPS
jgi:quercetin dioxygenase-like cupin family protein